mgnify:CR=1 FL=1
MMYTHQTKKLSNLKGSPNSRAVSCVGFILNRYDRRRLNKLINIFGNKLISVKNALCSRNFYIEKCIRISYFEYDSEYVATFKCTDKIVLQVIIKENLFNDLLKYRNDCIDFDMCDYDLFYVKTLDIGNMTLKSI